MTDYSKGVFVTECAYNALVEESKKIGLELNPAMGLMYLPSQEVTRQFQEACRAVLVSLGAQGVVPKE